MLQLILSIFCHVGYVVCRHGLTAIVLALGAVAALGGVHMKQDKIILGKNKITI
jgi:hypothetical protein